MSELSKLLGTAGPPHQINHEGRVYTFHLLDQPRKNALEKRLYQQAKEAAFADRENMTSDEYVARLNAIHLRYEDGDYSFYGERSQKILQGANGSLILLEVITGESQEDVARLLMERPDEVKLLVKTVLSESFKSPTKPKPKPAPEG